LQSIFIAQRAQKSEIFVDRLSRYRRNHHN